MTRHNYRLPWLLSLLGLALSSYTHAYIPPSQYLLKSWVKKRGVPTRGKKPIRMTSLVEELDAEDSPSSPSPRLTGNSFKDVTWVFSEAGKSKSIALEGQEKRFLSMDKPKSQNDLIPGLLFSGSFDEIANQLKANGTPILTDSDLLKLRSESTRRQAEKTSLKRLNGHVAYVVGQNFWMEKDTFFPLKLSFDPASTGSAKGNRLTHFPGSWDAEFSHYSNSGEFYYPKSIRVLKDGKPLFRVTVTEVVPDSESFHWSQISKTSPNTLESWEPASSALKELILSYYELLR